jgi:hypothetical protein
LRRGGQKDTTPRGGGGGTNCNTDRERWAALPKVADHLEAFDGEEVLPNFEGAELGTTHEILWKGDNLVAIKPELFEVVAPRHCWALPDLVLGRVKLAHARASLQIECFDPIVGEHYRVEVGQAVQGGGVTNLVVVENGCLQR